MAESRRPLIAAELLTNPYRSSEEIAQAVGGIKAEYVRRVASEEGIPLLYGKGSASRKMRASVKAESGVSMSNLLWLKRVSERRGVSVAVIIDDLITLARKEQL